MDAELTGHLGYERGDPGRAPLGQLPQRHDAEDGRHRGRRPAAWTSPGTGTARSPRGWCPRAPAGSAACEDMIISLYAGGMTVRDIQHHLAATLGTELSHETISQRHRRRPRGGQGLAVAAAGGVLPGGLPRRAGGQGPRRRARPQQGRAPRRRGRHGRRSSTCSGSGCKHTEGAKFWAGVCAELANRGVRDVLIVCCDGLTGLPEAIEATWPHTTVQTCVVHLIRASMRFVSYGDRKAVAAAAAPDLHRAHRGRRRVEALGTFADSDLGRKYPATVATWQHAWERFIPFLAFRPGAAQDHLHHQRDRVAELPAAARSSRTAATSPTTTP